MITNDARCKHKIKYRIVRAKTLFNKKALCISILLRKKVVKCYTWSIAVCGAVTWTLLKVDQKYLGSFQMWCWRRMEKIS